MEYHSPSENCPLLSPNIQKSNIIAFSAAGENDKETRRGGRRGLSRWVCHKCLVTQTFLLWLLLSQYYQFPGISEKCSLGHFNSENFGCLVCFKWLELHQTTVIKNASEGFSLAGSHYFWGRIGKKGNVSSSHYCDCSQIFHQLYKF